MLSIAIRRKSFTLPDGSMRPLFENLSLQVLDGEVCAIVGPSGVGKSSLLAIAAGIDTAFDGEVAGRTAPIGFAFQSPRLLPWRTVEENLRLAAPQGGVDAVGWLHAVGLDGEAGTYPERLSAGMAQRVALARALAVRPALLLLDEPFATLDERTATAMRGLLAHRLDCDRPTTLIVTHDPADVAALADRVVALAGSPARIIDDAPAAAAAVCSTLQQSQRR
ncbi:MAG TPA: ABC transporter ATP-binding protein [Burkholderiaceae bacterium]|nr:ABC transporter ATP-binding protein [Burkholderiaceae bacterium]